MPFHIPKRFSHHRLSAFLGLNSIHAVYHPVISTIRPESEKDYLAVYNVNFKAFNQDYEPKLVEAIRKSVNYIPQLSFIAVLNISIVGHILFSTISIKADDANIPVLGLAPVAVLPEYQIQGIGSKLIE